MSRKASSENSVLREIIVWGSALTTTFSILAIAQTTFHFGFTGFLAAALEGYIFFRELIGGLIGGLLRAILLPFQIKIVLAEPWKDVLIILMIYASLQARDSIKGAYYTKTVFTSRIVAGMFCFAIVNAAYFACTDANVGDAKLMDNSNAGSHLTYAFIACFLLYRLFLAAQIAADVALRSASKVEEQDHKPMVVFINTLGSKAVAVWDAAENLTTPLILGIIADVLPEDTPYLSLISFVLLFPHLARFHFKMNGNRGKFTGNYEIGSSLGYTTAVVVILIAVGAFLKGYS